MKKPLLAFSIILSGIPAVAQSNWHWYGTASVGTSLPYVRSDLPEATGYRSKLLYSRFGWEAGIDRLQFRPRSVRQYGLHFSSRGLKTYGLFSNQVLGTQDIQTDSYRYLSLEIPLGINWRVGKRKASFAGIQARMGYRIWEKVDSFHLNDPSYRYIMTVKQSRFPRLDKTVLGLSCGRFFWKNRHAVRAVVLLDMSDIFLPKPGLLHETHYYAGLEFNTRLFN